MPVLPDSPRYRATTLDTDPLRYLRGVLTFFLGGGAIVALVLAVTGLAPKALLLASLLWALFGILSGMVDVVLGPLAELAGDVFSNVGLVRTKPANRVTQLLHRAEQLAGPQQQPEVAVLELEALQRGGAALSPADDIRLGLALCDVYQHRLNDPGKALGELRRLIDRYPHLRQTVRLRALLAELRAKHFPHGTA